MITGPESQKFVVKGTEEKHRRSAVLYDARWLQQVVGAHNYGPSDDVDRDSRDKGPPDNVVKEDKEVGMGRVKSQDAYGGGGEGCRDAYEDTQPPDSPEHNNV